MLVERYRQDLAREDFQPDSAQEEAARALQRMYDALLSQPRPAPARGGWLGRIAGRNAPPAPSPVRGLYLWGGVGRGKTYLVDLFHDTLPLECKLRRHFHRFMRDVHVALRGLRDCEDPLKLVARDVASRARVLCLDEFYVSDIADAMILSGLLEGLFAEGVVMVATSNIAPGELYKGGLQRARFLPAIERIERHMEVMNMDGGVDYRLRFLDRAEIYHHPLDERADPLLADAFEHVAPERGVAGTTLDVEGRPIPARRRADGVVWFEFAAICDGPRSQVDYIEIARCHHTVLIGNVPVMDWQMEDQARRFISMVDEFYDRNVKLICTAAAPADEIYRGKKLAFEFRRAASRLLEMQTHQYLARGHLP